MIEATLKELIGSTYAFNAFNDMKLRGKLSFKIARAIRAVQPELEAYDKTRKEIIEKYYEEVETKEEFEEGVEVLETDEDAKPKTELQLLDGKEEKDFVKELEELLDTTVELGIEKIPQKPFESLEITPLVLSGILWLIED